MDPNRIDIEKTWGSAWLIYKSNLKSILLIILVIYFPFFIIRLVFPYEQIYNRFGYTVYDITNNMVELIGSLVGVIAFISLAIITEHSVLGLEFTIRDVFVKALSRWWAYIKAILLSVLIVSLYLLLFIIPGFVKSIQYAFVTYAAALRDVTGKKALDFSKSITKGQRWRVFGFYLLIWLLGIGPAISYFYLLHLAEYDRIILHGALIINYFISPFFSILFGVLFLDLEKQWNEDVVEDPYEHSLSSP